MLLSKDGARNIFPRTSSRTCSSPITEPCLCPLPLKLGQGLGGLPPPREYGGCGTRGHPEPRSQQHHTLHLVLSLTSIWRCSLHSVRSPGSYRGPRGEKQRPLAPNRTLAQSQPRATSCVTEPSRNTFLSFLFFSSSSQHHLEPRQTIPTGPCPNYGFGSKINGSSLSRSALRWFLTWQ